MKKRYIAPSLIFEDILVENMICTSYKVDPTKTVGGSGDESGGVGQLSNSLTWDEEDY